MTSRRPLRVAARFVLVGVLAVLACGPASGGAHRPERHVPASTRLVAWAAPAATATTDPPDDAGDDDDGDDSLWNPDDPAGLASTPAVAGATGAAPSTGAAGAVPTSRLVPTRGRDLAVRCFLLLDALVLGGAAVTHGRRSLRHVRVTGRAETVAPRQARP